MNQGILCSDIYKVLAAPSYNYNITMFSDDGQGTINPATAKWFYVKPVNFMIQVPEGSEITLRPEVYLWKGVDIQDEQTKEVLRRLKSTANQYGYGFTIQDFGSGNLPKKFSHIAMRDIEETKPEVNESVDLNEGLTGSSKRSYYSLPKAKMIIIHSERIREDVRGSRSRNIKSIFIEHNGERRRLKTNSLYSAKAMTRHLNEGGQWSDRLGNHIQDNSSDMNNLKGLLSELEINGKGLQAKKVMQFIKDIKQYLKQTGTVTGYRESLENIKSTPRVGNKYIDEFAKRLSSMLGSSANNDSFKSYSRQYLTNECKNLDLYSQAINNNSSIELDPNTLKQIVKKICLGIVPHNDNFEFEPTPSDENKVLMFGNQIMGAFDDEIITDVLETICSKPHLLPEDAKLICALGNSLIGSKKPREILPEADEIKDLKEWINKQ